MIDTTWGVNVIGNASYIMMLFHIFFALEKN